MVNNLWSATVDIEGRYKDFGFFVRPRAYYDFAYDGSNANDSPLTNNNGPAYGGPLSATDEFMDETKDLHRSKAEILDAYAYGGFSFGEQFLDLRVGRQVVNWGQALYSAVSIGTAQNAIDATKLESELGWEAQENFDAGIRKTVQWYLDNDWWWRPIRERRYAGERLGRA